LFLFTLVNCSDGISDVLTPDASDEAVVIVDERKFCRKLAGRNILKKRKNIMLLAIINFTL